MPSAGAAWIDISPNFAPFREALGREIGPALAPVGQAIERNVGTAFHDAGATAGDALRDVSGGLQQVADDTGELKEAVKDTGASVTQDLLKPLRDLGFIGAITMAALVRGVVRFGKEAAEAFLKASGQTWESVFGPMTDAWNRAKIAIGEGIVNLLKAIAPLAEIVAESVIPVFNFLSDVFGLVAVAVGKVVDLLGPVLEPALKVLAFVVVPALLVALGKWAFMTGVTLIKSIGQLILGLGAQTVAIETATAATGAMTIAQTGAASSMTGVLASGLSVATLGWTALAGAIGFALGALAGFIAKWLGFGKGSWDKTTPEEIGKIIGEGAVPGGGLVPGTPSGGTPVPGSPGGGTAPPVPLSGITTMSDGRKWGYDSAGNIWVYDPKTDKWSRGSIPQPSTASGSDSDIMNALGWTAPSAPSGGGSTSVAAPIINLQSEAHFHGLSGASQSDLKSAARLLSKMQGEELRRIGYGRMG